MATIPKLADYDISETIGFLCEEPLDSLPPYFKAWDDIGSNISALLSSKQLRDEIHKMGVLDASKLEGRAEHARAHLLLSIMCNGYVWQDGMNSPAKELPAQVAVPLSHVSSYLGLQQGICYSSIIMANWKMIDRNGPMVAENLTTQCTLPGGDQFVWFVATTVQAEKEATFGLKACLAALKAMEDINEDDIIQAMVHIRQSVLNIRASVKKVHDGTEALVFFDDFGSLFTGWGVEGSPLIEGLVHQGVSTAPHKIRSANASQSSIFQSFDAVLGVKHDKDKKELFDELLEYMPRKHKEFVLHLRSNPNLYDFVHGDGRERKDELVAAYNACIDELVNFRSDHIQLVTKYVIIPLSRGKTGETEEQNDEKPTGLIPLLKEVRTSTGNMKRAPILHCVPATT